MVLILLEIHYCPAQIQFNFNTNIVTPINTALMPSVPDLSFIAAAPTASN